jgi:hypothetical protein
MWYSEISGTFKIKLKLKNSILAIAIPTFNRPDILNENIRSMLPEIEKFSIPVYISDDSTNDETKTISENLKKDYANIFYYRNSPGLGHDRNCIRTLSIPSEDYVWYLGDSVAINSGGLRRILEIISKQSFEFICVNVLKRVDITDRIFIDGNELLINLGWHLTLTGATVYSKNVLNSINKLDIGKCHNFPQTAIIFERFAIENCRLFWLNEPFLVCSIRKESYWKKNVFEVFLNDWNVFISSLPSTYSHENKIKAIRMHSNKTGIFSLYSFLSYRYNGIFDYNVFKYFCRLIRKSSNVNLLLVLMISFFPKSVIGFFRNIFKKNF